MGKGEQAIRFLFLYSATGGGHRQVALAVAEAVQKQFGGKVRITLADALADYAPWPLRRAPDWYGRMLWGNGWAYGLGYRLLDGGRRTRAISHLCWPWAAPAAWRLLREHPAEAIAIFHPVPLHTITRALQEADRPTPLVAVGSDLVAMHAFWASPGIGRYLVATEAARERLIRHGVEPARIEVTGLPVGQRFLEATQEEPSALRRRLGLDPDRSAVLMMAGGEGFGPLEPVARAIAGARLPAQIVILTGHNRRLQDRLARQFSAQESVRVEGFRRDVHFWMRAADLLVTKAGPNTIAEALVVGLPMVLWGAIPAQETPNIGLVTRAGAGVWAPGPRRTAAAVARLLADEETRTQMRERARQLARPEAAKRMAEVLGTMAGLMPEASLNAGCFE